MLLLAQLSLGMLGSISAPSLSNSCASICCGVRYMRFVCRFDAVIRSVLLVQQYGSTVVPCVMCCEDQHSSS
jgi:hypothetical protein